MAAILIVDDEKSIRTTLAEFLRGAGYTVETAEDAAQAERWLHQQRFDIVLTDIVLPRVSGVELLQRIRTEAPDSLVLMMTGEPTVDTTVAAVRAGAYDYLVKPVSKEVILRVIGRAIEVRKLQEEQRRLEAANREYQTGLERMVEERTRSLRESEALYHSLVENLPQNVIRKDVTGRFTFANERFCQALRRPLSEILGKTDADLFPAALAEKYQRDDRQVMEKRAIFETVEEHQLPDGKRISVQVVKTPLLNGQQEVTGVQGIFWDITERRRLERLAEDNMKELARSNEELAQFAYVASHDLQEPLRKIQAFGDRLAAKCAISLGAEGQDYLRRMQDAARRMSSLIDDLLSYSRVATTAKPFKRVNLNEVAHEVVEDLETRIQRTGGHVEVSSLPVIDADPLHMRQLLQNLIGNALKFHKPDVPPVVRVFGHQHASSPGTKNGETNGGVCEILVQDQGIGFDEKYLDRIFTVFQRLHGRGEYEGSGVGLAICRKIARRHGGDITAQSTPGEGTTFIVTLPVKQAQNETAA
jgi:PAS domain S-box-containing protein